MSETEFRPAHRTAGRRRLRTLPTVRLLGVPVDLFLSSAQHADDLVRELWLVSLTHPDDPVAGYQRLAAAADVCVSQGAELRNDTVAHVLAARERGDDRVDLDFAVPEGMAEATLAWDALLDEMDDLCRAGTLLTLAPTADVLGFRRWYVGETVRQIQHGQEPTAYADWLAHGWSADRPHDTGA